MTSLAKQTRSVRSVGSQTILSVPHCPARVWQRAAQYKTFHTSIIKPINPFKNRKTPQSAAISNLTSPVYNNQKTARRTAVGMHGSPLAQVINQHKMDSVTTLTPQQIASEPVTSVPDQSSLLLHNSDPMLAQMVRPPSPVFNVTWYDATGLGRTDAAPILDLSLLTGSLLSVARIQR